MALDEATTQLLTQLASMGGKQIHEMQPAEARAAGEAMFADAPAGPSVARVDNIVLAATDGGQFEIRVMTPSTQPDGILVYLHGGGWVVGNIDGCDALGREIALRSGFAVVLVNYRKAPEDPYPAAVEDAWTALLWAAENMVKLAGRPVSLVVAGDSAGGNLAAVLSQRARDRSGPHLDLQVLIYPVTNADLDTASYQDPANQLMLSKDTMIWFWDHYADVTRRNEPDASPLRASDLTELPPALVLIAEHDVLRSEGEAYAAALSAAGVPVEQKLFEGQMHGFFGMLGILPGSAAGIDFVVDGLKTTAARRTAELSAR